MSDNFVSLFLESNMEEITTYQNAPLFTSVGLSYIKDRRRYERKLNLDASAIIPTWWAKAGEEEH
jgi:hypothetical protein